MGERVNVDTLSLLSQALRGAIVAPPGKLLFVADYSSIEARVLLWCAKDEAGLDLFRKGADLYCDMAAYIYKRPITKADVVERALGKIAILGLGYQMGAAKFFATCMAAGIVITEELAEMVVQAYRAKYWRVKQLWFDTETAAGEAAYSKDGSVHECGVTKWFKEGRFLYCQLPSGRRLAYPDPQIKAVTTSWGARRNALTYMSVNALSRKWMRQTSYGGLLVENTVQAISRDVMAEAIQRLEETRIYAPVLTVHDEVIAEANEHLGNLEEFVALVGQTPVWAEGCPIAAEGFCGSRYRK